MLPFGSKNNNILEFSIALNNEANNVLCVRSFDRR